ncbi:flagellar type III secretion system protein FliR [Aestuariirhabdus sp. Z084]|uniref:flagellar biosynthetic protein FliR n=1 Tax=Aestuariirhabdus haliotis TaxID=2918751 RepID=UPI00201B37E0|nr:flagellar biosynthetic protein FliR [Aestuariirhabdus haliotis]MCL6414473.1 flagellar type III secretion system protein FliR [Aestuariirhabdus haliotis]MCL6418545.1 flagellar type III secretion system protein FliR [Aestuariirhabdus haliotis]
MIELSTQEISGWVSHLMWPLFRIASLFMVMPIIGTQLVPTRVRLLFAIAVTALVAPMLPDMPEYDVLSLASWVITAQQVLIGSLMGFVLQLFFHTFALAGQMIAMQMGLGFASLNDPANGVNVAAVGQMYLMLVTLLFLAMNGHLVVIQVVVDSFLTLPVGQFLSFQSLYEIVVWFGWIFGSALLIAIPAMSALLIVNLTFGVMTKSAPQLNVFALGFPMTLIFGLFIIWVAVSGFLSQYSQMAESALFVLKNLVGVQ